MPTEVAIRLASAADAAIIAWHRARMWQDMGDLPDEYFEPLRARAEVQFRELMVNGSYVGWLAAPSHEPQTIVAGAGVYLRASFPSPRKVNGRTIGFTQGRLGSVINVFTEPEWRRRGVAIALFRELIAWARKERIDRLVLHASDAGRPLYEKLGFVATNEMRLADL